MYNFRTIFYYYPLRRTFLSCLRQLVCSVRIKQYFYTFSHELTKRKSHSLVRKGCECVQSKINSYYTVIRAVRRRVVTRAHVGMYAHKPRHFTYNQKYSYTKSISRPMKLPSLCSRRSYNMRKKHYTVI